MIVFPEKMDKLDPEESKQSFLRIQDYIRYMVERVEHAMRVVTKQVGAAGISNAEVMVQLGELSAALATLSSTMAQIRGNVTGLQADVLSIKERLDALESAEPEPEEPTEPEIGG